MSIQIKNVSKTKIKGGKLVVRHHTHTHTHKWTIRPVLRIEQIKEHAVLAEYNVGEYLCTWTRVRTDFRTSDHVVTVGGIPRAGHQIRWHGRHFLDGAVGTVPCVAVQIQILHCRHRRKNVQVDAGEVIIAYKKAV